MGNGAFGFHHGTEVAIKMTSLVLGLEHYDGVFVAFARDPMLVDRIPLYPAPVNGWKDICGRRSMMGLDKIMFSEMVNGLNGVIATIYFTFNLPYFEIILYTEQNPAIRHHSIYRLEIWEESSRDGCYWIGPGFKYICCYERIRLCTAAAQLEYQKTECSRTEQPGHVGAGSFYHVCEHVGCVKRYLRPVEYARFLFNST